LEEPKAPGVAVALTAPQELFCQKLVALKFNATDAYLAAYPKSSRVSARAAAARLLANASIADRVAEIAQAVGAQEGITPARVLREAGFIAFQRASSIFREDGTLKAPSEWDEATEATIAGIETEEAHDVAEAEEQQDAQPHGGSLKRKRATKMVATRTHKVKRWDKGKALELLMRHFGMLKEDAPHPDRPKFDLSKLSDETKNALLTLLRAAKS
jgi:phage terminase small subunit